MIDHIDFSKLLLLDIETVPLYPNLKEVPEKMKELWLNKSERLNKEEVNEDEFYQRAGIYAEFGKIVCISMGGFYNQDGKLQLKIHSLYGNNEVEILESMKEILDRSAQKLLCAHNGKEFDFPYMARRMIINGIPLPDVLKIAGKKPWEVNFIDTMELWKFGDYKSYTSLDLLTHVLGIPTPKDDIKGSDVYKVFYEEKDPERIAIYCEKDVLALAQLLLRFNNQKLLDTNQVHMSMQDKNEASKQ